MQPSTIVTIRSWISFKQDDSIEIVTVSRKPAGNSSLLFYIVQDNWKNKTFLNWPANIFNSTLFTK